MTSTTTNKIIFTAMLLIIGGCASSEAIYRNYDKMVDSRDGVTAHEAKIIAQKDLIGMQQRRDYRMTAPDINNTPQAKQYPGYWFVVFGHNWFSPMSTDPMAKTYTDLREAQYVVVIDKQTGVIKFSGEWYPKRANNFDWVFNPQEYRQDNSLVLPPYEKGRKYLY